jgi:hypothetical protein
MNIRQFPRWCHSSSATSTGPGLDSDEGEQEAKTHRPNLILATSDQTIKAIGTTKEIKGPLPPARSWHGDLSLERVEGFATGGDRSGLAEET